MPVIDIILMIAMIACIKLLIDLIQDDYIIEQLS